MPSQRNVDPRLGPFKPGDRLEQYEIRRLLAAGRHAFVYEAQHTQNGPLLAIKVIVGSGNDGQSLEHRVQSEARVLTKLQHPRLVRVLDAAVTGEDLIYIVMELLEGRTLRKVYREHGKLTPAEVLAIGAQIAQGVEAAHAKKVVHGDLRPENVFVQEANEVKVLDLGSARFLSAPRDLAQETLLYMAPEHLRELGVTPRSDIFALGTLLYEGLAGRPPALISAARLGSDTLGVRELSELQIAEPPPALEELLPGLPRHVAQLVHKMIAKQPADRHGSMREVAEALVHGSRRLLEGSGGRSDLRPLWRSAHEPVIDSASSRSALTSSDPTPPPAAASGRFEAHRSARGRSMALGVSIAVLAGIVIAVTTARISHKTEVLAPAASPPPAAGPSLPSVAPALPPAPPSASAAASAIPSASSSAAPRMPAGVKSGRYRVERPLAPAGSTPGADPRKPWLE